MTVVASVPSGHVYVRHLEDPDGPGRVRRLPDPPAPGAPTAATWWPPVMLDAAWVRAHENEFDVLHVHFGFDHLSLADLADLLEALRETRTPLVLTVHDLRNPHHADRALHDAQLDLLVPAADALVTLTEGAAGEIGSRWGRTATVLPHPHVVDEETLAGPRPGHRGFVVGVHVKSLRAGMDPLPVIREVVDALPALADTSLRVDAHVDVMTPGHTRHDPDLARELWLLASTGAIDLQVHDYFSDAELWAYLSSVDVSVLPYRFGTHSGWLEACHDLGTTVLAPDCGYYAEQRPCVTYAAPGSDTGTATPSLTDALTWVHRERPVWRADPRDRRHERRRLARAHEAIYGAVVAGRASCTSS